MKSKIKLQGKFAQVTESLDVNDAISNQIILIRELLQSIGYQCEVYSKWFHPDMEAQRKDIESLNADEKDIILYHFYGHSEYALQKALSCYATKILVYHNITPHNFFDESTFLYDFCKKGREQLIDSVPRFHRFWGDSDYNIKELIEYGAKIDACSVFPIIVPRATSPIPVQTRECGSWIFVGRIAPNKNQIRLVELFNQVRIKNTACAEKLYIVGGFDPSDLYYIQLNQRIKELGLGQHVEVTGKLSEDKKIDLLNRTKLYVSLSLHEGFGVPLIEAPNLGLPVIALNTSAVGETMQGASTLGNDYDHCADLIVEHLSNQDLWNKALLEQQIAAKKYSLTQVGQKLETCIARIVPHAQSYTTVSVVICTYNRLNYLKRVLEYLKEQTCRSFEIVIVDGPSDDGTKDFLATLPPQIKIAHNNLRNLSISRNIGIEHSAGDIIAFIDDDAIPFDDWITNILFEYNSRPLTTAGLGGPVYYAGTFWFQAEDNGINSSCDVKTNIPSCEIGSNGWFRYNTGTNATFVRSTLISENGFDEQYDYFLDESELCFRLQSEGYLIGYSPEIIVRHEFAQSHNRGGKFNYNWFSICKNTSYFIASYNNFTPSSAKRFALDKVHKDRIQAFESALRNSEISAEEFEKFKAFAIEGTLQGIEDHALYHPRIRTLSNKMQNFLPYLTGFNETDTNQLFNKKLHICIVSKEFPPFSKNGGVGTLYYNLASELLLKGHRVTVITEGENGNIFKQGRFSIHFLAQPEPFSDALSRGPKRNICWSASVFETISSLHRLDPIDVVDSALWDTECVVLSASKGDARPILVTRLVTPFPVTAVMNNWDVPPDDYQDYCQNEEFLLKHSDLVVPISESISQSIKDQYPSLATDDWKNIACGICHWPHFDVNDEYDTLADAGTISEKLFASNRVLTFIGRLEGRKGVDLIFRAANRILDLFPDVVFLFAGRDVEDWENKFSALMEKPEYSKRLHFVGEISQNVKEKILSRSYALIFPSRYESFGLVPLEAYIHGLPVVASNASAIPEVVEDGVSGLLFASDNYLSLAAELKKVLENQELHNHLSRGALAKAQFFSSRRMANLSLECYESALNSQHGTGH